MLTNLPILGWHALKSFTHGKKSNSPKEVAGPALIRWFIQVGVATSAISPITWCLLRFFFWGRHPVQPGRTFWFIPTLKLLFYQTSPFFLLNRQKKTGIDEPLRWFWAKFLKLFDGTCTGVCCAVEANGRWLDPTRAHLSLSSLRCRIWECRDNLTSDGSRGLLYTHSNWKASSIKMKKWNFKRCVLYAFLLDEGLKAWKSTTKFRTLCEMKQWLNIKWW